ncbi:MAG: hypothetical protein ABI629_11205 [bacterium]
MSTMFAIVEEYAKHSALNAGQVLQGLRHVASHPGADVVAAPGTTVHLRRSVLIRAKRVLNDFCFAVIPPHWHHTRDELRDMRAVSMRRWFLYGYSAWRFDQSGEPRSDLRNVDPRWDPRCQKAEA